MGVGFCVGVHATGKLAPVLVCTHVGRGFCAGVHTIGKLDLNGGVTQCDATGNALVCTQGGSLVLCWCACNREAWFYAGVHARGKLGSVPRPSDRHSTLCRRQATFPVGFNTGLPTALATRQQASLALSTRPRAGNTGGTTDNCFRPSDRSNLALPCSLTHAHRRSSFLSSSVCPLAKLVALNSPIRSELVPSRKSGRVLFAAIWRSPLTAPADSR